jgi:chromosome segregation ATPase
LILAARTNSEKIEAAEREIQRQGHLLQHLEDRYRIEVGVLQADLRGIAERFQALALNVAVVEQRLAQVEKLIDEARTRRWQVWLAVLGAILSAVIALIVALVKK